MPLLYQRQSSGMMLSTLVKSPYRLAALAVALSVITAVHGSDNQTGQDGDFRWRLPEVLSLLCPYDMSCRGGESRLQLSKGKESCCTECSCKDSCGLTERCCYPEQASGNFFDRRHQQCELPSTSVERLRTGKRFYIVTGGYGNGSREDCGTGNVTCGENEAASALGSWYPVSSKTTTLIYKNEQCARCHGVARSDMKPWQAVMSCLLSEDRFDTLLQSLETGRVHSFCWLDFYYPGPQSEINVHMCYEHTKRSCQHDEGRPYYLPSYLNLTDDEVRAACLTGPQAQYRHFYNLFCFLCNYGRYTANYQCIKDFGARTISPGTFSALLGAAVLEKKVSAKRTDTDRKAPIKMACKRRTGLQNEAEDCRPVLCPSGKVQRGSACVFPAETMFSRNVEVAVKLYPGNNRPITSLTDHLKSYIQQGTDWRTFIKSQGLKSWYLRDLCYHDDTQQATNNGSFGFFWMKLTLEKTTSQSYSKMLANVDKFMTRDCEFVVGMNSVPLEQRFSEFESIRYDRTSNSFKPLNFDNPDLELNCTRFGHPTRNPSIQITKSFFCDQVALKPEEYIMDKRSKKVYVNDTGRVFRPAEYSLGYDASGDPEPRLCLEDTDYVLVPQQQLASSSVAPTHTYWSIIALLSLLLYSNATKDPFY